MSPGGKLTSMFQFTLPRGERHITLLFSLSILLFQFTLPRGERRLAIAHNDIANSFNSRSREGSDRGRVAL